MSEQDVFTPPEPGQSSKIPLDSVSRHRIFAGLQWEPLRTKLHIKEYDLDLACYAFAPNGKCSAFVTGDIKRQTSANKKIYHTGDDKDGTGNVGDDIDDERVYVELFDAPDEISEVFFVVASKNKFAFGDIKAPVVRIVDGNMDLQFQTELMTKTMGQQIGAKKHVFVYARLYRQGEDWYLQNISQYRERSTDKEIGYFLKQFLGGARTAQEES